MRECDYVDNRFHVKLLVSQGLLLLFWLTVIQWERVGFASDGFRMIDRCRKFSLWPFWRSIKGLVDDSAFSRLRQFTCRQELIHRTAYSTLPTRRHPEKYTPT